MVFASLITFFVLVYRLIYCALKYKCVCIKLACSTNWLCNLCLRDTDASDKKVPHYGDDTFVLAPVPTKEGPSLGSSTCLSPPSCKLPFCTGRVPATPLGTPH